MKIKTSDWAIAIILMLLLLLLFTGCKTIPQAPTRNEELGRQCAEWNFRKATELGKVLKGQSDPKILHELSNDLIWGTEAVSDWMDHPEKPYDGNIKKLVLRMDKEDSEYHKEMSAWKSKLSGLAGMSVGGNSWYNNILFLIIAGALAAGYVLKKIPFL